MNQPTAKTYHISQGRVWSLVVWSSYDIDYYVID